MNWNRFFETVTAFGANKSDVAKSKARKENPKQSILITKAVIRSYDEDYIRMHLKNQNSALILNHSIRLSAMLIRYIVFLLKLNKLSFYVFVQTCAK